MGAARSRGPKALDALGNPVRREILSILGEGPHPVGTIAERLPISRPAVSRHLIVLERAGLVRHETRGTSNLYQLDRRGFDAARGWLDRFWDDALRRFALLAENTVDRDAERKK